MGGEVWEVVWSRDVRRVSCFCRLPLTLRSSTHSFPRCCHSRSDSIMGAEVKTVGCPDRTARHYLAQAWLAFKLCTPCLVLGGFFTDGQSQSPQWMFVQTFGSPKLCSPLGRSSTRWTTCDRTSLGAARRCETGRATAARPG